MEYSILNVHQNIHLNVQICVQYIWSNILGLEIFTQTMGNFKILILARAVAVAVGRR